MDDELDNGLSGSVAGVDEHVGPLRWLARIVGAVVLVPVIIVSGLNAAATLIAEFFAPVNWLRWPLGNTSVLDDATGITQGSFGRYVVFAVSGAICGGCAQLLARLWGRE